MPAHATSFIKIAVADFSNDASFKKLLCCVSKKIQMLDQQCWKLSQCSKMMIPWLLLLLKGQDSQKKLKKGDMETASSSQQVMCSFNDSQVSQLEPR